MSLNGAYRGAFFEDNGVHLGERSAIRNLDRRWNEQISYREGAFSKIIEEL